MAAQLISGQGIRWNPITIRFCFEDSHVLECANFLTRSPLIAKWCNNQLSNGSASVGINERGIFSQ
jgi:hypothetical protein